MISCCTGQQAGIEKERFDNLLSVAGKLPVSAIPHLIRAIIRPIQSELMLSVAEKGAGPDMTPPQFFFDSIISCLSYEKMLREAPESSNYLLSLSHDIVLPWPWSLDCYIDSLSTIGRHHENPWKQDPINHYVELWLPWNIGFVRGGNHSITAGILAGEGEIKPQNVYDLSYLFETVKTDGKSWFVEGKKVEDVQSGRTAAVFEIGRILIKKWRPSRHV